MRFVAVPLDADPMMRWQSLTGQGIVSELDERTGDSDHHPTRLNLDFESGSGDEKSMEFIWGCVVCPWYVSPRKPPGLTKQSKPRLSRPIPGEKIWTLLNGEAHHLVVPREPARNSTRETEAT